MSYLKQFLLIISIVLFATHAFTKDDKMRVAIFDFTVSDISKKENLNIHYESKSARLTSQSTIQTNILTDKLITALMQSGRVNVIERSRLEQIMQEMDLCYSGVSDSNHCVKIGKITGAQFLIFGSIDGFNVDIKKKRFHILNDLVK